MTLTIFLSWSVLIYKWILAVHKSNSRLIDMKKCCSGVCRTPLLRKRNQDMGIFHFIGNVKPIIFVLIIKYLSIRIKNDLEYLNVRFSYIQWLSSNTANRWQMVHKISVHAINFGRNHRIGNWQLKLSNRLH